MKLTTLTSLVNAKLAGELLTYKELVPYLDDVIDDINTKLNSKFPVFSELEDYTTEYTYFPDVYLRKVVVPGAAWYYYVMDEEGTNTALQFQSDYDRGLFYMLRDYLQQVPEEYQCDSTQGSIEFPFEKELGTYGMQIGLYEGVD